MWWHVACEALQAKRRLAITYDGHSRIVEVHCVGTSTAGNPVMRAWQVSSTKPGAVPEWRLFKLSKAWRYAVMDEISQAPRPGYKPRDSAIPFPRCKV